MANVVEAAAREPLPLWSGKLLGVDPNELRFPFESRKQFSCTLKLTNSTNKHVAFNFKTTNPKKYVVRPSKDILAPRSKADVVVTMQAMLDMPPNMQCRDKFLVQSAIVASETKLEEVITGDMFTKESGNIVDEVKLKVVYYVTPSSPSEGSIDGYPGGMNYLETTELDILERIVDGMEEPRHLDFSLLQSITDDFSDKSKIGVGGCGEVYKGTLRNGVVAVKKLRKSHTVKDKMFDREVDSLIMIKHQNIVRFLGFCSFTYENLIQYEKRKIRVQIRERLLCFEYVRNGSLETYLTDELRGLEWHTRYEIILGICKGLHYLHKDKGIIHMDLKPANILLDDDMVPKITDFGLSRLNSDSSTTTTTLLISRGYCAPEYLSGGKPSSRSDIYSLGVIIIELVTGSTMKPNINKVLRRWNHRWIKSLTLTSLGYQQVTKCLDFALRCVQHAPTNRPDIVDIVNELNKIDSKDGQTKIQDILGIEPLEMHIPLELDQKISHSIELSNDMDDYFAFITKAKLHRFRTEPDKGIVPPRSKCSVTVTKQSRVSALPTSQYKEEITVLSTRVDGSLDAMDITGDMFIEKEDNVVDEVNVTIVFGTPPLEEES